MLNINPPSLNDLKTESKDLVGKIIKEQDPDKFKDLSVLFDINQRKKNIARMDRLSDLLELVDDEVILRLSTDPSSIADKDLINYMDKATKSMTAVKQSIDATPTIQINNQTNEIHIEEGSGFDRESRKRILDAVMSIIESTNDDNIIEVEDLEEEE